MREAPELERFIGMELFLTDSDGIGGRIRCRPEDFVVEEELCDGSRAEVAAPAVRLAVAGQLPGRGSFLLCVLVKKGMDTLEAIRRLANCLQMPEGLFGFAGLKDAHALTAQFVTIRGLKPGRLEELRLPEDLALRPVRYVQEPLGPGSLIANHFRITVRGIRLPEEAIGDRLASTLKDLAELGGLPNYFGHQRFGTARPVTHLVGRELVRGHVRRAVELFLAYVGPGEGPRAREARAYLAETGDLRGFLRLLPRGLYYERLLAEHLLRKPRDHHGALRRLPLRLRKLFVQAYQAYIFNRFLSARAREGLPLNEPEEGDWVVFLDEHGLPTGERVKAEPARLPELRKLVREGKAALSLPLPGYKQELSAGRQGELEEAVLEEEGVGPEDFKVEKMPELAAPGGLRPALASFTLEGSPVVREDELELGARELVIAFRLPRGAYATVFLRELMKPPDPLAAGF